MSEQNVQTHPHIMPDDCKALMSEAGYAVLADANLAIDIQQSVEYMRTYRMPFAAVYDQIPVINERVGIQSSGAYTCIKDDEFGATDDETAKATLARLGVDLADAQYWLVYLTELDAPNEEGLTKVFTLSTNGLPADKTHFAGFGWKLTSELEVEGLDPAEQETEVLENLNGIELWLNDMIVAVTLRDADDGMYLNYYEALKRKGAIDSRLISHGKERVESLRSKRDYQQKKAEFQTKTHVIPDEYQHLVSDESKALLAEQGLLIKISKLPQHPHILSQVKWFGLAEDFPSNEWMAEHGETTRFIDIRDEDMGTTNDETASNLMAHVGGDLSTMSYWVVYAYKTNAAHKWDHTKFYTTDKAELPDGVGKLVGICTAYHYGIEPQTEGEDNRTTINRENHEAHIALMTDDDKAAFLSGWQSSMRNRINNSLEGIEVWANGKLVQVAFHRADNGDYLYGYPSAPYKNTDATEFNAQLQAAVRKRMSEVSNSEANARALLKTVSAA